MPKVFYKDPHDSLEIAIKKTILAGYSGNDCYVVKSRPYLNYTSTYETAIISFSHGNYGWNEKPFQEAAGKCPILYRETNGVRYFALDKNHPDKFVFFNIGQSTVPAEPGENKPPYKAGKSWDETLRFLP